MTAYLKFGQPGGPYQTVSVEHKKTEAPRNPSRTGYGGKIPTEYMVKWADRWRRVYAMCYSNSASLYILVDGETVFFDID